MKNRFYSFNSYLRNNFGERVHRISLNAGFGCPNLDGTLSDQGCIFCDNKAFSPYSRTQKTLDEQIKESIEFCSKRYKVNKFIAYFQSFSSTYADKNSLGNEYEKIRKYPQIVGLFVSTRPDCVNEEILELLSGYQKDYLVWIEYGLQTTQDNVLRTVNRNHSYADFLKSLSLTRKYGINVGVHMVLGLPSASYRDMMDDANRISQLDVQGVKFHVLHVLRGTKLYKNYDRDNLKLLTQTEYVRILCDFLEKLPLSMVVLRLVSTASSDCLVAPSWMNRKNLIIHSINNELRKRTTHQGFHYQRSRANESISNAD